MSEPEFLISVLDRHSDWAIIICLIGGGQEIDTGEAVLPEWFYAIQKIISIGMFTFQINSQTGSTQMEKTYTPY